jgi:hypothetical protein
MSRLHASFICSASVPSISILTAPTGSSDRAGNRRRMQYHLARADPHAMSAKRRDRP